MSPGHVELRSESELLGLAVALVEPRKAALSPGERALVQAAGTVPDAVVASARSLIQRGDDPLGDAFCTLRSAVDRRPNGAVYTPAALVAAMLDRASQDDPRRVVDAGSGSGRFLLEAARRFPSAELVAVETDPLALLILRANVAVLALSPRTRVVSDDYRTLRLPPAPGRTLFVGIPRTFVTI